MFCGVLVPASIETIQGNIFSAQASLTYFFIQWVKNNIANFGGDPTRVTIMGQSSGGTSVIALLMSPLASNLFHGAIAMSASTRYVF